MEKRFREIAAESGQTLVLVAIAMVVLLLAVALAVDVGHAYSERRHMQNAADAAALEAARARCFDDVSATTAASRGRAFALANYPQVQEARVDIYADGWEFEATVAENVQTFFARIVGINTIRAPATARAACGPSQQACGLFPLAFSEDIWSRISNQCGKQVFVWTGDLPSDDYLPNCETLCDCTRVFDNRGNLIPDAVAVADVGRAWLDFTSAASPLNPIDCGGNNGCGTQEIKCWISSGSRVLILDNTCVSGNSGKRVGVQTEIERVAGGFFTVPLFDARCTPSGTQGRDCDPLGYNISGFGCVQVGGFSQNKVKIEWKATPTPGPNQPPRWPASCVDDKMVYVYVACDECASECATTSGGGDPGSGVKGISLIK